MSDKGLTNKNDDDMGEKSAASASGLRRRIVETDNNDSTMDENCGISNQVGDKGEDYEVKTVSQEIISSEEDAIEKNRKTMPIEAKRRLQIYTTRLEDMVTFNTMNLSDDPCKFLRGIESDSKPYLKTGYKKVLNKNINKRRTEDVGSSKINIRKSRKGENEKCSSVEKRRKRRSSSSEPLVYYKKLAHLTTDTDHDKAKLIQTSKNRVSRKKTTHTILGHLINRNNFIISSKQLFKLTIRLLNENLMILETYYVTSSGEIIGIETKEVTDKNDALKLYPNMKIICCWHKRQLIVKQTFINHSWNSSIKMIARKHDCPPGICVCCEECINELLSWKNEGTRKNTSNASKCKTTYSYSSEIVGDLLIDCQTPLAPKYPRTLIDKALAKKSALKTNVCFERVMTEVDHVAKNKDLKNVAIEWSKNKIFILLVKSGIENGGLMQDVEVYNIDEHGEIITFNKKKNKDAIISLFSDKDGVIATAEPICFYVCCWQRRETLIYTNFSIWSPETIKFMRTNHTCPLNGCQCCCPNMLKLINKTQDIQKPETLTTNQSSLVKVNNTKTGTANKTKQKKKPTKFTVNSQNQNYIANSDSLIQSIVDEEITKLRDNSNSITSKSRDQSKLEFISNTTTDAKTISQVSSLTTNLQSSSHINENNKDSANTATKSGDATEEPLASEVNIIVQNILTKFQGSTLVLDADRRVQILLKDELIDDLSNVEIGLLKHIVTRAQAYIDSQHMTSATDYSSLMGVAQVTSIETTTPQQSMTAGQLIIPLQTVTPQQNMIPTNLSLTVPQQKRCYKRQTKPIIISSSKDTKAQTTFMKFSVPKLFKFDSKSKTVTTKTYVPMLFQSSEPTGIFPKISNITTSQNLFISKPNVVCSSSKVSFQRKTVKVKKKSKLQPPIVVGNTLVGMKNIPKNFFKLFGVPNIVRRNFMIADRITESGAVITNINSKIKPFFDKLPRTCVKTVEHELFVENCSTVASDEIVIKEEIEDDSIEVQDDEPMIEHTDVVKLEIDPLILNENDLEFEEPTVTVWCRKPNPIFED